MRCRIIAVAGRQFPHSQMLTIRAIPALIDFGLRLAVAPTSATFH
jgi:hypothetical protein